MEDKQSRYKMLKELFTLRGDVVITGAAGLMGQSHAEAVLEAGGNVILIDINKSKLEKISREFHEIYQDKVSFFVCDITNEKDVFEVASSISSESRKIIGLINNAAINPVVNQKGLENDGSIEKFDLNVWDLELNVGLKGAFICTKVFGQMMVKNKHGSIINISSDLGLIAPDQRIYQQKNGTKRFKPVTYSVIKHGLVGLTKYTATYWNESNIRCNALLPGGIFDNQDEEFIKKVHNLIPLGRMAHKDEYKGSIIFLLSDASSYMTGSAMIIDGGRSVW